MIIDQHISESLLVANCIVRVKENKRINITVVNTSDDPVTVNSNLNLKLEPFNTKSGRIIANISESSNARIRTSQVLKQLRTSHLNQEEVDSLFDICSKYSDIFHLPNDQLTHTFPICPIQNPEQTPPSPYDPITLEDLGIQLPTTSDFDENNLPLTDLLENLDEIPVTNDPESPPNSTDPQFPTNDKNLDPEDFGLRDLSPYNNDLNIDSEFLDLPIPPIISLNPEDQTATSPPPPEVLNQLQLLNLKQRTIWLIIICKMIITPSS
ncbi:hypothetical protein ACJJTC_005794 [Scirpophaga incertulas]